MKIFVKAKTGAKEDKVTPPPLRLVAQDVEDFYIVSVKEWPVEGRANEAIAKLLAKHFGVPQSLVRLLSGATSKRKVFDVVI